jgi:hypothetical protein
LELYYQSDAVNGGIVGVFWGCLERNVGSIVESMTLLVNLKADLF